MNSKASDNQQVSFKEHAAYHAAIESDVCEVKQPPRAVLSEGVGNQELGLCKEAENSTLVFKVWSTSQQQ